MTRLMKCPACCQNMHTEFELGGGVKQIDMPVSWPTACPQCGVSLKMMVTDEGIFYLDRVDHGKEYVREEEV